MFRGGQSNIVDTGIFNTNSSNIVADIHFDAPNSSNIIITGTTIVGCWMTGYNRPSFLFTNKGVFTTSINWKNIEIMGNTNVDTTGSLKYYGVNTCGNIYSNGVYPQGNSLYDMGSSGNMWKNVYASTFHGSLVGSSDVRLKTDIAQLSEKELRVAFELKRLFKTFKYKQEVQLNGNMAQTHIGVIAQDVILAFQKHGLNAETYGIYYSSEKSDCNENDDSTLGIRYDEILCFIMCIEANEIDDLKLKIEKLENKFKFSTLCSEN